MIEWSNGNLWGLAPYSGADTMPGVVDLHLKHRGAAQESTTDRARHYNS